MFVKQLARRASIIMLCASVTACSTISGWFADEEELEIRRLDPIESQFTPVTLWSKQVGNGVEHYFSRLHPAIAYDKVFAASRHGLVSAFAQDSGDRLWHKDFSQHGGGSWLSSLWSDGVSAKIAGGLSVAYETLYFGTEHGDVYALDANSGEIKWQQKVKGEVLAAPALDEGVVVVNTGSGMLFALDANSGEQLWQYESDVPALSLRGISAPAAAAGGAITGTANGKLVVNLIDSGQTVWEQRISAPSGATELDRIVDIDSKPLVLDGVVYVISFDGALAAVELRSGRVIWNREYRSYRRLSLQGNRIFVVDVNGNIFSLDRRNGVEQWSQSGIKNRSLTAAQPIADYVVVGDRFGYLHWLSQEDGTIVARMAVGEDDEDEGIFTAPVVAGDTLYTLTRNGKLVAIKTP